MPHSCSARSLQPPSRHDNPFATCWTRPGELPFHFNDGETAEHLVAELAVHQWRGAIIGPHGSGKSTLLETLKPALAAAGRNIRAISLRDGQRRLPRHFLETSESEANSLFIIDGYEQLAWMARLLLLRRCRSIGGGLLVTSHQPVHIPTLVRLAPDRQLVEQLVDDLCVELSTTITRADLAASCACHGSNVREILFDLYDRHERQRRESNSLSAIT